MAIATIPALHPRPPDRESSPGEIPREFNGSPLGELEFDAPVAGARFFVSPLVERLEFAETSCGQAVRLHPLADQVLRHRDSACG